LVGIQNKLIADAVVVATPNRVIKSLLGSRYDLPDLPHHSHVSVHLLVPENATAIPPRSFTIPVDIQSRFKGLRACSLINEKFPGRAPTNESLFRFYFRPESVESVNDRAFWVDSAVGALDEIFGLRSPITWTHFAPWVSALPTFSEEYLGKCDELKRILRKDYDSKLVLVGAEVTGAGLEAAARSGFDAAVSLVNVLYE
jgi:protoporphyrinogen oxidase